MKFLVDANVLSEPTKRDPDPSVADWLDRNRADLVVDAIVLGELRFGILRLERGRRRQRLEEWFDLGARRLRCLPWDAETGLRWAELLVRLKSSGRPMQVKDSMIAATALVHGLTIATRNRRDFAPAGVPLVDPFSE